MRSVGSEDRVAGVAKCFEARVVRVFVEEFGVGGVAVELGWEAG